MATSRSKHTEQVLRTTDLVTAAYLQHAGHEAELVEMEGEQVKGGHPQGAWEFEETPALRQVVDAFEAGQATVEPRAFHQLVNQTRREMFAHLGIGN